MLRFTFGGGKIDSTRVELILPLELSLT